MMKRWTRVLAILLSLLMLLSLSACGEKAADPIVRELIGEDANAILLKNFESPLEYYRAVEQRRAQELMSIGNLAALTTPYESGFAKADLTASLDQSALERDLLDLVTEQVGFDLSWFKSLGLGYSIGQQDELNAMNIALRLNDTDLVTVDAILDQNTMDLYCAVPTLKDSWMRLNYLDLLNIAGSGIDLEQFQEMFRAFQFAPEEISSLAQRYHELLLNNVEKVGVTEGSVTAGGLENKCSIASVKLEGEDLLRLAKACLDAAAEDPTVEKLVSYVLSVSGKASGSTEELHQRYTELMGQAREKLENTTPEDIDNATVLMDVYIDAKGEILGRRGEFRRDDRTMALISYLTARDGDKLGLDTEFATYTYVSDNGREWIDENQVFVSGSGSFTQEGKLNGSFLVSAHTAEGGDEERSVLDLPIFTANVDGSLGKEGFQGELELIPTEEALDKLCETLGEDVPEPVLRLLRSLSLNFTNSSSRDKLDLRYVLRSNARDLLTLSLTAAPAAPYAVTIPTETVAPGDWARSLGIAELNGILNRLMEAGVPSSLINGILG